MNTKSLKGQVPSRDSFVRDEQDFGKETDATKAEKSSAEELSGKLKKDNRDDKLLHSKINVDQDKIDKAKVLNDAINNNISSFSPDLAFESMVNNYSAAKKIMGPTLIRELTGYDPDYIEKNVKVPEFQRELRDRIKSNIDKLKEQGLLEKDGTISEEGYEFSSLSLLSEELDKLEGQGYIGKKESKKKAHYGERYDTKNYSSGDRYKDITLKQTVKKALRRQHQKILKTDLVVSQRRAKGKIDVIYAIDSSGSMKGEKVRVAKKAGIALSYNAIKNNDNAGLIIFGSTINSEIEPSNDFYTLIKTLNRIKTKGETDIGLCIEHSAKLFKTKGKTKHIVILTDALQTLGKKPEREVMEKASLAANQGITISIIGIGMNKTGESLAKKIVDISKGTLYKVRNIEDTDQIVLDDYYRVRASG